jgi:hypothetical protein
MLTVVRVTNRFTLASIAICLLAFSPSIGRAQSLGEGNYSPVVVDDSVTPEIVTWGVGPITMMDVERIEDGRASEATLARFEVPAEAARHFARGFIIERGELDQPFEECLYLPKLDIDGRVLGHFFVFSTDRSCRDWGNLVQQAAQVVEQARAETPDEAPDSAWQLRAHELTAESFYTISVSGYLFRPPLDLSHRGLPLFLMVPAELPTSCGSHPRPEAIVLADDDTVYEAVSYPCRGGSVRYSHYALREMSDDEALWPDLPATLSNWKLNVQYSGSYAEEGLEHLNWRWFGRMRTSAPGDDGGSGGAP